jgi:hypothetical protein
MKAFLWLVFLGLIPATSGVAVAACESQSPADSTQVVVKRVVESPPTYSYEVRNRHKSPILIFSLGDGDREEMQAIPDNIPKRFVSPAGWESGTSFKDGSIYMQVFWKTQDPMAMIAPGQSLGGFTIEMPPPLEKKAPQFHLDGTPARSLNMTSAPFTVYFEDGTCVSGRVREEK